MDSLVLVHGAGSGPWVFDDWGIPGAVAVDLHAGLDVTRASMADYAQRVVEAVQGAGGSVGVVGWSMGGLVAMMAAMICSPSALVVVEPSAPAEIQGRDPGVPLRYGTYDPEEAYGRFPPGMAARPESRLARAERKRGISVFSVPCRMLVVHGSDYAGERGRPVAARYQADQRSFADLGHFELITSPVVREAILAWLG